ncbi:hypothetical protein ONZ45_g13875 [Pleurotus djamor]|nr:hypothetical protein ONZ45_g13875 [Pleurotus djamor]
MGDVFEPIPPSNLVQQAKLVIMPFINHGTIHVNGSVNDVAGNQINNFHYHCGEVAHFMASKNITGMELPEKEPYATLALRIAQAHQAFSPIPENLSTVVFLREMEKELSDLFITTTLAGQLIDKLERRKEFYASSYSTFWVERESKNIQRWCDAMSMFVDEILRYRDGLRHCVIGPIWCRVLWSVMFSLRSDFDIAKIVHNAKEDMSELKIRLEQLLVACVESRRNMECLGHRTYYQMESHIKKTCMSHPMVMIGGFAIPEDSVPEFCGAHPNICADHPEVASANAKVLAQIQTMTLSFQNISAAFTRTADELLPTTTPNTTQCLQCLYGDPNPVVEFGDGNWNCCETVAKYSIAFPSLIWSPIHLNFRALTNSSLTLYPSW